MKVRPGYKQTEVGVIPEDWEVEPLGTHASFRTGPFGSALHQSDYITHGVPVINPMHINDGKIIPSSEMSISETAAKRLIDFRMKSGELVIGRRGDMGRCAVVMDAQNGWICGTGSMLIRPEKDCPEFLQRVLSSSPVIRAIEESSVGSTMINLNQETLSRLKLQFPLIQEQRAIAAALSDMDALLDGLNRLIAKKRAIKQAAMQQLLTGQTRLPGFCGEWEVKQLGDMVRIEKGQLITANSIVLGNIPVIAGGKQPAYFHAKANRQGKTITVSASGANAGYVSFHKSPIFASDCSTISESEKYCIDFLFHTLTLRQEVIYATQTGGAQPHVQPKDLATIVIKQPANVEEQTAIAAVLSDMDAEITTLETRLTKTRALKQAMMQELLTGKTRLV